MTPGDSIFPDPDKLNHMEYGKFVLTNLAAKRARQIRDGAPPLVRIESNHPLSIALAEIAAGKIKPVLGTQEAVGAEIDEYASLETAVDTEGLLLPSIDEDDLASILTEEEMLDRETEDEPAVEADEEVGSIADLLGDEDLSTEAGSDDEISLDDLASEEEGEEEGPGSEDV